MSQVGRWGGEGEEPRLPLRTPPRVIHRQLLSPFLDVIPWGPRDLSEGLALFPAGDLRCGTLQTLHPEHEISEAPSQLDITLRSVLLSDTSVADKLLAFSKLQFFLLQLEHSVSPFVSNELPGLQWRSLCNYFEKSLRIRALLISLVELRQQLCAVPSCAQGAETRVPRVPRA